MGLGIDMSKFGSKRARTETSSSATDDEIKRYEAFPAVSDNIDALQWWKSMSLQFPGLAKVAREYLAIPGSSASSERAFSAGGNMVTKKRASLATETVQASQCLRSWLKVPSILGLSDLASYSLSHVANASTDDLVDAMGLDVALEHELGDEADF